MDQFRCASWVLAGVVVLCGLPLAISTLAADPGPSEEAPGQATGLEVGATFHGFWGYDSEADATQALTRLREAGGTWVRMDVGWDTLEPSEDVYSQWAMEDYDAAVDLAHSQGMRVVLVLQRTPQWASGSPDHTVAPIDPDDFGDFALWLAQRYTGKIDAIELWNEPNHDIFFQAQEAGREAEEHAAMVKDAYRKIKSSGPTGADAVTVLAGSSSHVDVEWWRQLYAVGIKDYTDVVAVNPYPMPADLPPTAEEDGTRYRMHHLAELLRLMRGYGDADKPVWFAEFGWSDHPNGPDTPPWERGVTLEQQADYLEQTNDLVRTHYPQVEKMFWYNLTERDDTASAHTNGFGLLERDGTPKPVWERMAELFGR